MKYNNILKEMKIMNNYTVYITILNFNQDMLLKIFP